MMRTLTTVLKKEDTITILNESQIARFKDEKQSIEEDLEYLESDQCKEDVKNGYFDEDKIKEDIANTKGRREMMMIMLCYIGLNYYDL